MSLYLNFARATDQAINRARSYGDMPLIVLSAMDTAKDLPTGAPAEALAELPVFMAELTLDRDALAALSSCGENRPVSDTSHYIQMIRPQVVIAAVREAVAKARAAEVSRAGSRAE